MAILVDTSVWVAFLDPRDRRHEAARTWMEGDHGLDVVTTDILDETVTLTQARCGHHAARQIGDLLQSPADIECVPIDTEVREAAWSLFCNRPDKGYSLTDCTSFVVMRKLGIETAATFDQHFEQEGFTVVPKATP